MPTSTLVAAPPLLPVAGACRQVPLVDGRTARRVDLDVAASAPALRAVADHVADVLPLYGSVHRGAGWTSQVSTALYESARARIADFVGAREDDVAVVVRNTTDALNLLASAIPADANGTGAVLFLDVEHHANLLPWRNLPHRCVAAAHTLAGTVARVADALAEEPFALLAVTGSSNVTGELLPIAQLADLAQAHGARLVVDAAQLAPHRRIDLAAAGVDYVAFSGHKLYAPFGAGALVGRRDWLDAAPPHLAGGGAVREVSTDHTEWAPAPHRHEAGTPNVVGATALAAACQTLADLPEGVLAAHEAELRERLATGLRALPGVRVLSIWPDATERIGVVSFTVEGHDPGRVAAYLSAEHGIGVRDGRFCAHPLMHRLAGDGAVRASLGVGSSSDDVDALLEAVEDLLTGGERWTYALDGGRWVPSPDPRPLDLTVAALLPAARRAAAGDSPCRS
ncbi:MAG: aminotransferase class V-fold PLP-dependent enzyme [Kineosporiaceae bacterium]